MSVCSLSLSLPSQAGCCVTDVSGKAFCSSERSKRATPTASTIFDLLQIKYTCQGGGANVTEYCQSAQLSLLPGPGGADYPESRCLLEVSAEFTDRTSKEHVRLNIEGINIIPCTLRLFLVRYPPFNLRIHGSIGIVPKIVRILWHGLTQQPQRRKCIASLKQYIRVRILLHMGLNSTIYVCPHSTIYTETTANRPLEPF